MMKRYKFKINKWKCELLVDIDTKAMHRDFDEAVKRGDCQSRYVFEEGKMNEMISFSEMTPAEQQAFADLILHEIHRHHDDITRGYRELAFIRENYGIMARTVYCGEWIEVDAPGDKGATDGL